jgi:hypothetical protein
MGQSFINSLSALMTPENLTQYNYYNHWTIESIEYLDD